jgi:hypothetical protein
MYDSRDVYILKLESGELVIAKATVLPNFSMDNPGFHLVDILHLSSPTTDDPAFRPFILTDVETPVRMNSAKVDYHYKAGVSITDRYHQYVREQLRR